MTVLGKILVFFVLFLSLVWSALTVNAYVTRTNWKNALDATAKKLDEAAASARNQKDYADAQKAAADAALAGRDEEIRNLRQQLGAIQKSLDDARQQLTAKTAAQQDQDTPTKLLQNTIAKLENQVNQLQASQNAAEQRVNTAVVGEQKAKDAQLTAEIDRDASRRRAEELEKLLLRASGQSGVAGTVQRPQVHEDFKATVESVTEDLAEISLGAGAGVQKGAELAIYRSGENRYLGKLIITQVGPYSAVGQFQPVRRGEAVKKGDTVIASIR